jgi:hypothetical protein
MNALDRGGRGTPKRQKCSAVRESVSDSARRRSDIHEGHCSFQFVMPGLVEEVAEADYSGGLSGEVHGQACAGASEGTDDWIQFPATALQIRAGDCEIRGIASGSCYEQNLIWLVPEFMRGLHSGRRGRNEGQNCPCRRHGRVGKWSLRAQAGTQGQSGNRH